LNSGKPSSPAGISRNDALEFGERATRAHDVLIGIIEGYWTKSQADATTRILEPEF
jgi:hypothetical protein